MSQSSSHKVLAGTGVIFLTQIVGQLLMVWFNRFVLSTLSIGENGELFFIQKVGTFVLLFFVEAGMFQIVMREVVQKPHQADAILASLFKFRLFLWLVFTAGMVAWAGTQSTHYMILLSLWSLSFLLSAKGTLLRTVLEIRDRAEGRFLPVSLLGLLDTLLLVGLMIVDTSRLTVMQLIWWYVIAAIPGFVILFWRDRGMRLLRIPFSRELMHDIVVKTMPFILAAVLFQIHDNAEIFFLELYGTKVDLGVFGAVFRVFTPLSLIVTAFMGALFPPIIRFQQEDIERCKEYVFYGLKFVMLTGLYLAAAVSVCVPWVITLFTGGTYSSHELEFTLYIWLILPNFIVVYSFFTLVALGMQKQATAIPVGLAVASIVLSPILTAAYLAPGAIVVKLIANFLAAVVALRLLGNFFQNRWLRSYLVAFCAVALGIGGTGYLLFLSVGSAIALVAVTVLFAVLVFVAKLVGSREKDVLLSFAGALAAKFRSTNP